MAEQQRAARLVDGVQVRPRRAVRRLELEHAHSSRRASLSTDSPARWSGPRLRQRSGVIRSETARSRSNCSVSSPAKAVRADAQRRLVVELERAVVEVRRADRRPAAVDGHRLGVQHRRLVLVDLDARPHQLVVGGAAGDPDRRLVDVRARHEHAHAHAALGRVLERLGERRARDEVGRGEVDRLLRGCDREVVERLDVGVADARRWSARPSSARRPARRRARAGSCGPASTSPVASSQFSANAPNRPRTTGPATRTCVSRQWSGSSALPVHSSAMPTPPVSPTRPSATRILRCVRLRQALGRVRLGRAEAAHPHAGLGHLLDQLVLELHAADRVDDHVALDARRGALAQRVGDLVRDLAAPVDVGEQADASAAPRGSCAR